MQRSDDVLSLQRFRGAELTGMEISVEALNLLALWWFLARHADHHACVFVRDEDDRAP